MEFSFRRVNALFKKELNDLSKNINVSIMYILPIIVSFIFSKLIGGNTSSSNGGKIYMLNMCVGMNITIVSCFVMSILIAEEKEKNTLRTLMLSGVSPLEFFTGKALITFVTSETINVVMFFIFKINTQYLVPYILLTTLVVFSMIGMGVIVGIVSPNQMATGVVGMPILMIFLLIPTFTRFSKTVTKIAELLPNYNMNLILEKVFKGEGIGNGATYSIAVILIWIIITATGFVFAYNKVGLDN